MGSRINHHSTAENKYDDVDGGQFSGCWSILMGYLLIACILWVGYCIIRGVWQKMETNDNSSAIKNSNGNNNNAVYIYGK